MILVLCGTQKQDFSRMVNVVATIKDEEIVVQGGHNTYDIPNVKNVNFVSTETLHALYDEADIVVTHAGAGSMIAVLQRGKKVIAFPRLKKYGEHVNDHQVELAQKFEQLGYLKMYRETDSFQSLYEYIKRFVPKPYEEQKELVNTVDAIIQTLI